MSRLESKDEPCKSEMSSFRCHAGWLALSLTYRAPRVLNHFTRPKSGNVRGWPGTIFGRIVKCAHFATPVSLVGATNDDRAFHELIPTNRTLKLLSRY